MASLRIPNGGRSWLAAIFVVVCAASNAAPARAGDVGDVAVIEDATGKILPASEMCAGITGMAYSRGMCIIGAGHAFYATHPDEYDILIFFTNKTISAMNDPKLGLPVQADVKGIGNDTTPWTWREIGSQGRLIQAIALGSLVSMPDDPHQPFSQIKVQGIEVVGHEIGHHWMAYINIDMGDGPSDILRGYREDQGPITHWSCWFNSDSVMYGGMLTDNGDGTFTDVNGPRKYSYLDQYLMGLRTAEEVGPMWFVRVNMSLHGCADWPDAAGVPKTIEGERVDFNMDDVIRAMGPRNPATSRCHYKLGMALVHPTKMPPTAADIAKVELYRSTLEEWWKTATDDRGSLDTSLGGCGTGTVNCPGEPSPHCGSTPDGDQDGPCTPGEQRCNEQKAEICNGEGDGWVLIQDCAASGDHCEDGDSTTGADGDTEAGVDLSPDGDGPTGGSNAADKAGTSGSGCAGTAGGGAGVFLAGLVLLMRRRSRRTARVPSFGEGPGATV